LNLFGKSVSEETYHKEKGRLRSKVYMNADEMDMGRRRFLTVTTSVIGGIGAAFVAFPFAASWEPSVRARALGAPVEVDISKIEPGQKITVAWRGQPVFVVHRTKEELENLKLVTSYLRDPDSKESVQPKYADNPYRSEKPEIFVVIGICTHLGCVPLYKPEIKSVDATWEGGFFCPCHGSKYDMAGRVYKGVPAPLNLPVPPYQFLSDSKILVGEDVKQGAA
jgi:ubiquinol-cytochrome c reductase iron-sulfur subunit